jgi:outer membrane protein assembly factor BamB
MSDGSDVRRRPLSFLGFWLPFTIIVLSGGAVARLWLQTAEPGDGSRVINSILVGVLAVLLLSVWAVLFSGWRWYVRLGIILLEFAVGIGLMRYGPDIIVFDGEMRPSVRRPWVPKPDDVVARHRQSQGDWKPARAVEVSVGPYDWPEYRGRRRDGVVEGPKLSRDWQTKPPKLLWKQPCGPGWASFAVAGNVAITIEQRHKNEAVVAYDIDAGHEVWKHEYPAQFIEPLGGPGPRATPTIADGEVFSLGATGHLVCLNAATGDLKWSVDILDGKPNLDWAMSGSPLLVDSKVIVNPGRQNDTLPENCALLALDRKSGHPIWSSGNMKAGYSSPMLGTIAGARQIILLDGKQVGGYDPAEGTPLWSFPWDRTNRDINVAQPLVLENDRVFISSGYSIGCVMLQVTRNEQGKWEAAPLWQEENRPLRCKLTSPVAYKDFLYGIDDPGILACVSTKDGKLLWRDGRYGHGQLLRYEDLLIVLAENGDLVLVEATPKAFHELGRVKAIEAERTWNVPAMANGRIYVRNDREMACFDLRE